MTKAKKRQLWMLVLRIEDPSVPKKFTDELVEPLQSIYRARKGCKCVKTECEAYVNDDGTVDIDMDINGIVPERFIDDIRPSMKAIVASAKRHGVHCEWSAGSFGVDDGSAGK